MEIPKLGYSNMIYVDLWSNQSDHQALEYRESNSLNIEPKAAAIEKSLVTVRQQRRRIRRNYRFIEEYIPPEYAYDYESEYEYNYEGTGPFSWILEFSVSLYTS